MACRRRVVALAALVSFFICTGSGATESGRTAAGEPYLVGGVGEDEVAALGLARDQFSLWVRTALKGSGSYVADVHLRIGNAQGRVVFDKDLSGPWLLIGLAPGRYTVQASWSGQVQSRVVNIAARGRREAIFYFDSAED